MTAKNNRSRQCPGCAWAIEGKVVTPSDRDWLKFNCASCDEEWYENVKYCKPELISPDQLYEAAYAET